MTSLLFSVAIIAALVAMGMRRSRRTRLHRAVDALPGGSIESAIPIRSFDDMDEHLRGLHCVCGGFLARAGEGSRDAGGRRYRVARLRCDECEEERVVFFDTTDLLQ